VPHKYKSQYKELILKHSSVVSIEKNDKVNKLFHKMHIKDNEPIYRKQFKIPDAYRPFLEESLAEWLKLGIVQYLTCTIFSRIFKK
jgi:hypothetical protein